MGAAAGRRDREREKKEKEKKEKQRKKKERERERERDARRKTQDILLNKQYMFISRGELDSRKM